MSDIWTELDIEGLFEDEEQPESPASRPSGRGAHEKPTPERKKPARPQKKAEPREPKSRPTRPVGIAALALSLLCGVIGVALVGWVGANAHIAPPAEAAQERTARQTVSVMARLDGFMNNAKSDAVGDLTYIRKLYTIPENDTVAPEPDAGCYFSTSDPAEVRAVIDSAAVLLEGQGTVWNEDIVPFGNSVFSGYVDETILVITWKELIDNKVCTCAEVRIADGSQLRRKLTEDTYDSGIRATALELAEQSNAVLAMNADFYAFRPYGITVYRRELYRWAGDKIDTCFFTASGEMLMTKAGAFSTREETEQFIADNDILFSASFGPILVDDGELIETYSYPIGEIERTYSRSAIGMTDKLHYFAMTINYDTGIAVAATVNQLGRIMYDKGCADAYTLDGGQTSEMCMLGETLNHVDWGAERPVSDIIYFATALPPKGGTAQ